MHGTGGSGSEEPDPPASPVQVEALRRRLYARGPAPDAVRAYLSAEADRHGERVPDGGTGPTRSIGDATEPVQLRRKRRRAAAAGAVVGTIVLAATLWWTVGSGAALPERVGPPAAPGRTLLYYSRRENPESAPDKVTFEPADEWMLFHADGRRLVVVLRCIGQGTVRITAAEQPFDFRCDERLRTFSKRSTRAVRGPFLVLGRTVGDVVWGMRLTSVPDGPPSSASS